MLQLIDFQGNSVAYVFKQFVLRRFRLIAHVKTSPFCAKIHAVQSLVRFFSTVMCLVLCSYTSMLLRLRNHEENLLKQTDLFQFHSEMLNERLTHILLLNEIFSKAVFIVVMQEVSQNLSFTGF